MYQLPYFVEKNIDEVIAIMKEYSFAVITGLGEDYPVATHIPLTIEVNEHKKIFLKGHLMRNTDHHQAFLKNNNVLVIFNGPHTYVSASWYTNPPSASTWNYITVHAKGKILFGDEAATYQAIKEITNQYEPPDSEAAFSKLSEEYIQPLLKAIVGFTIEVEQMDNVFKLSQNKDEATRLNIIHHLQKRTDEGSRKIAEAMKIVNK